MLGTCAIVLAAGLQFPAYPQETSVAAVVGQVAPDIQVSDWIGGDGRSSLEDFRGEVVFLEFWSTRCSTSRGQVAHLTKLAGDLAKKGLNIVGITGEDRRTVLQYMTHADAGFGYAVALGGASGYPSPGLPYAALVGPDGKLEYLGPPGGLSTKAIEELVRKVQKPTQEQSEARAAKMLASAEKLVADGQLLRAEVLFGKVASKYGATESAKKASARTKEIASGDSKPEYDAQKELAKLLGGVERPAEADTRRAQKLAKVLEKKSAEWKETAPRAAALAAEWATICATPWK